MLGLVTRKAPVEAVERAQTRQAVKNVLTTVRQAQAVERARGRGQKAIDRGREPDNSRTLHFFEVLDGSANFSLPPGRSA